MEKAIKLIEREIASKQSLLADGNGILKIREHTEEELADLTQALLILKKPKDILNVGYQNCPKCTPNGMNPQISPALLHKCSQCHHEWWYEKIANGFAAKSETSAKVTDVTNDMEDVLEALNSLLNPDTEKYSQASGCPMCDNGVLRNKDKEHWDNCNWNNARLIYERVLVRQKQQTF